MSERLTSPLTVGVELRKRLSAQQWAATYSHGGVLQGGSKRALCRYCQREPRSESHHENT
jgi:hypothetical protein